MTKRKGSSGVISVFRSGLVTGRPRRYYKVCKAMPVDRLSRYMQWGANARQVIACLMDYHTYMKLPHWWRKNRLLFKFIVSQRHREARSRCERLPLGFFAESLYQAFREMDNISWIGEVVFCGKCRPWIRASEAKNSLKICRQQPHNRRDDEMFLFRCTAERVTDHDHPTSWVWQ